MQVYSDGNSRVIKGNFPKRFKLSNAGVDVPFLRTASDTIRLSGEIPVGYLDVLEIEKKKPVKPIKFDTASFAVLSTEEIEKIDILNKKVALSQDILHKHLSELSEHEETLKSLETQNAQAIEQTNSTMVEMAKAFGKEIQADRDSITRTAESITSSLEQTGDILASKIEAHEKAKNPHKITKATIGLERVDNTSDMDKPISKAVQSALEEKADKSEIEKVNKKLKDAVKKQETLDRNLNSLNLYGGVGGSGSGSGDGRTTCIFRRWS